MRPYLNPETEEQSRETFVFLMVWTEIAYLCTFTVVNLLAGDWLLAAVLGTAGLALILIALWGRRFLPLAAIGALLILLLFLMSLYLVWNTGPAGEAVWVLCFPLAAIFVLGFRWGIASSLVLWTYTVAVFWVVRPALVASGFALRIVSAFILILFVALVFDRIKTATLRAVQRSARDLKQRNEELAAALEDLRRTRSTLVESDRVASLGRLVAGVAHEINTPLGNSVLATSFLSNRCSELGQLVAGGGLSRHDCARYEQEIHEIIAALSRNLDRMSYLVRHFKLLAVNESEDETREFGLQEYAASIVSMQLFDYRERQVSLEMDIDPGLRLRANPGHLLQIITSLVRNAMTHGFVEGKGGTLRLTARVESDVLVFVFADDGAGMDSEVLGRIFEPFFSTAHERGSIGLGLNIVHNVVAGSLGGTISCRSAPGAGTEFEMRFPASLVAGPV